jgi:hypothetical protein
MKRVLMLCVFVAMITVILMPAYSAEVYMWVDEKGDKHITDQPPENPRAKIIGKDSYKPNSPEEGRRYREEQKEHKRQMEAERRYNQEREESKKRWEANRDQRKENTKLRVIERKESAIERIDDLNARKERLRAIENRDYEEARRLRLKDERRRIDRDVKKYEEIKDQ